MTWQLSCSSKGDPSLYQQKKQSGGLTINASAAFDQTRSRETLLKAEYLGEGEEGEAQSCKNVPLKECAEIIFKKTNVFDLKFPEIMVTT